MPEHYRIIQAAHACHEIALELDDSEKPSKTSHLILFEAKNEMDLLKIREKLDDRNIKHHTFFEPDVNEFTSIATSPIYGEERKFFRKFKMFK